MQYKKVEISAKKRANLSARIALVKLELSNDVMRVKRVYPNLIELLSQIGGLAKVIIVACLVLGYYHSDIVLDMFIINKAILSDFELDLAQKDQLEPEGLVAQTTKDIKELTKSYNYFEVAWYKYFCCNKRSKRGRRYQQFMKVYSERMDIERIVKNNAYVDMVSEALIHPYQAKILSHFKQTKEDKTKLAIEMEVDEAYSILTLNRRSNSSSELHKKIDNFIIHLENGAESHGVPNTMMDKSVIQMPEVLESEFAVLSARSDE